MKYILLLTSMFLMIGCSVNQPNVNNMSSGVIKFYIMKGFYIKETPGDWQYKNAPIETPFISRAMDRNLTVYGTIIYREDWKAPTASIHMITNNEKSILGKWKVYNCDTKKRNLIGEEITKAGFDGENFLYDKGFLIDENCGMIKLNK